MNILSTNQGILHKTSSAATKARGYAQIDCRKPTAKPVAGWVSADKDLDNLQAWERLCPKCFK